MMKRTACLGDSNTYGFDPQSLWGERYPADCRWPDLLEKEGFAVFNFGQNGFAVTMESAHPVLVRTLMSVQPLALVTVMLGTNDLLLGRSPGETAASMEKLLSLILQERAAENIMLIAPPALPAGGWVTDQDLTRASAELAAAYSKLAGTLDISFADAGTWNIPLAYDHVHFTQEGHLRFAEELLSLIR